MKWVIRILSGIAGLAAIAFGLVAIFGKPVLPECGDTETVDTIRKIAAQGVPKAVAGTMSTEDLEKAVEVTTTAETAFDKDKQVRQCTGALSLKIKDAAVFDNYKIVYTIIWLDQAGGKFQVEVNPG